MFKPEELKFNNAQPTIALVSPFEPSILDGVQPLRYMEITRVALEMGYNVIFVTSTFKHVTKQHRHNESKVIEVSDYHKIVYLKSIGYKKNISIRRFVDHTIWGYKVLKVFKQFEKIDAVLATFPTVVSSILISKYCKEKRIPFALDVIDPWPDSFHGVVRNIWSKRLVWLITLPQKWLILLGLRNIDFVIGLSNEYAQWGKQLYLKATTQYLAVYPGVNLEYSRSILELGKRQNSYSKEAEIELIYLGSLSDTYDIPCILEAAQLMNNEKFAGRVKFHIVGSGNQAQSINSFIQLNQLENLVYHGRLEDDELMPLMSQCDIGLIQHKSDASQSITYKPFTYLGYGLVLINSLWSEVRNLIDEYQIGFTHKPSDARGLVGGIMNYLDNPELMKAHKLNALKCANEIGDNSKNYRELIEKIKAK